MDKECIIYIYINIIYNIPLYRYNGILINHKKEGAIDLCNNMDGLGGHYAK